MSDKLNALLAADAAQTRITALLIGATSTIADFTLTTLGVARYGLWIEGNPLVRSLLAAFGPGVFLPIAAGEIGLAVALLWSTRPLLRGAGLGWIIGMVGAHFFLGALTWLV